MEPQVNKETFIKAIQEMGHDPSQWIGKHLSLENAVMTYGMEEESILKAIEANHIEAQYDYPNDTIWLDALDIAHFYFCVMNEAHLYSSK